MPGGSGLIFANTFKVVPYTTTTNDTLAAGTDLPANGSYPFIGNCERYHVILRWGAINGADVPVVEPKQVASASGSPIAIDQTALRHTAAADDDNEHVVWTIECRKHTKGYPYTMLDVVGGVTNATLANVFMIKEEFSLPVTQTTTVLPTASQHRFTGGD